MASSNFAKAAAGAHIVCRRMCCVVLLVMAITLKGACAKTVLYNNSGRDLVLSIPQQLAADDLKIEVPAGQSVELEGAQQQRGVMIQDVESGAEAGPVDLPDNRSLEAVGFDPSTSAATSNSGNLLNLSLGVGNLVKLGIRVGG